MVTLAKLKLVEGSPQISISDIKHLKCLRSYHVNIVRENFYICIELTQDISIQSRELRYLDITWHNATAISLLELPKVIAELDKENVWMGLTKYIH